MLRFARNDAGTYTRILRLELELQEAQFARQRAEREARDVEARIMAIVDQRLEAARAEVDLVEVAAAANKAVEAIGNTLENLQSAASQPAKAADDRMEGLFKRLERAIDRLAPRRRDRSTESAAERELRRGAGAAPP